MQFLKLASSVVVFVNFLVILLVFSISLVIEIFFEANVIKYCCGLLFPLEPSFENFKIIQVIAPFHNFNNDQSKNGFV